MSEKTKKLLLMNLPYLFVALFATKFGQAWRLAAGADASGKLLHLTDGLTAAFSSPLPSFYPTDLAVGVLLAAALWLAVYVKGRNAKKFRKNVEYGSARWGKAEDIKPYIDPVFENNVILTQTERLTMNSRPKDPKTSRNKNVLVVGGSGSGKTRFFIKPNLMQCDSKDYPTSFVVTDPKGSIVVECGNLLRRRGYRIKILNTINFKKSMHYNPFAYIHSEKDILKLVTTLIANTKGEGKAGDDFWVKAETLLYCALIGYIHYEAPVEEQNFSTLIEFINAMEVREDDEEFKNPVDLMFDALEAEKPNHFAVRQYKKYKLAAGKTAKSILISCGARLAVFDIAELREVTSYDELELDTLGDRKTALFLIMSDTDDSFNFLISMCYTQLFNLLCEKADDVYGGRLPVHVRCLIDECANIGQIPKLEKLVATIRSREISACLVLQAQSQLKAIYKDNADTIIGNMDTSIFLGGKEPTTLKELAAVLGKETIDTYNTGESRGRETSHSLNYQKLGKELMSQDELAVMDGGKCILQLRGVRPFLSDKYDITKHPNYKYLSDYDNGGSIMSFFHSAIGVLQTLVIALGAGLAIWGAINLLEGYGNDNPGAKSQGIKQLMAGGGVALIGITLVPLLSNLFG
jgi:type IV secretion system protein VirD4